MYHTKNENSWDDAFNIVIDFYEIYHFTFCIPFNFPDYDQI